MKKNAFNQSVTASIIIYDRVQKTGNSTIYLRVVIDRKKKEFNLNETWPPGKFDAEQEKVLPRFVNDPDVDRVNMVISEAKGRANKIKMRYFGNDKRLNIELFQQEFINYMSGENFIFYWKSKADHQENEKIITSETRKHQDTSYNRLLEFVGDTEYLAFADIDLDWVKRFNAWLRKTKKLAYNTAVTTHKCVRAYLNLAIEDKYRFEYPYSKYPLHFEEGERDALEDFEIIQLIKLWRSKTLDAISQEVLTKFLFSCYTGLRLADNALVHRGMITANKLVIKPAKGFNYGRVVHVKLPEFAIELIEGRNELLFEPIAEQTCNRHLKIIAGIIQTAKKVTFRVSRDTFGTTFIDLGGDVYTLKELMGHKKIDTTMIYIKLSEKRKEKQMMNFNRLDGLTEPSTFTRELEWSLFSQEPIEQIDQSLAFTKEIRWPL